MELTDSNNSPAIITCLGQAQIGGTYLLRIRVHEAVTVRFGRFQNGRPLFFPAADYIYIGSALGQRGSTSLSHRLLRHASRSSSLPAHPIRPQLLHLFGDQQSINPPSRKTLHWHIDYLLDKLEVELVQIIIVQTMTRLEGIIGQWLLADKETAVIAPGLGATDIRGNSHILRIPTNDDWWQKLIAHIQDHLI